MASTNKLDLQVLLFGFVLIGTYCLVHWSQYKEIPWKPAFIAFIQIFTILRNNTCNNLIGSMGTILILLATRLPEVSIILLIVIFYPKSVYKFIKQSVEAILMHNRPYL